MDIEVSSNETIMPNEGVFQCDVSKSIDLLIFHAVEQVRRRNKRPDSSAIFKETSKAHATNFTQEDVENTIEHLTNEKKLVNNKAAAGRDSFFVTSFVKETFTETDKEPIPITQETPKACQVSTQTEDSNTEPCRSSSLEVRMDALKSSSMNEIYDLKNQIEFSNTGKRESDIVFSLREQIKLLKEENENKTFIIKSLLQNQNNLSNMGTNFFLLQRKLQSFDSKEQLNENPESNSSNNDVDFKMEPTIETNIKRRHDVNNTSKTNNDSDNSNSHSKNKEHIVKVRPFTTAKVSCMQDHVKPTIRDITPQQIILHVGTNDLKTERTASQIAKSIIDLSISLKKNGNMIAVSGIVPKLDELNSKAAEVNNRLELMCKQRGLPYISHYETIDPQKHLNESNLHLNSYGIRVFAENFSNFLSKSN